MNIRIIAYSMLQIGIQRTFLFCVVCGCLLVLTQQSDAQQRTWTDASGTYKVEAVLDRTMEVDGSVQAVLIDGNGQEIPVPIEKLCEADQKEVLAFMELRKKAAGSMDSKGSDTADSGKVKSESAEADPNAVPATAAPRTVESEVTTRPIELPIGAKSDTSDYAFDPQTAIRIDKEVKRDLNGQPLENPVYEVDINPDGIRLLSPRQQQIAMVLMDDTSPITQRRNAIAALSDFWPAERSQDLVSVVINTASADDKFLRLNAVDILASRDPDQSLGYVLARIDDKSFEIRSRAYQLLERIGDPRIIPELAERLDGADRRKVGRVLKSFGEVASPWVLPRLKTENQKSLLDICHLLGELGGKGVIEALQETANSTSSLLVKAQAESSIKRIQQRAAKATQQAVPTK